MVENGSVGACLACSAWMRSTQRPHALTIRQLCSHEGCAILSDCFTQLSQSHPHTRFVKIVSTDCIPEFPDSKLPTVLLYHEGKCVKSFAGLTIWGGKRAAPECAPCRLLHLPSLPRSTLPRWGTEPVSCTLRLKASACARSDSSWSCLMQLRPDVYTRCNWLSAPGCTHARCARGVQTWC